MHGAGNDYVYVDATKIDRDWPKLSIAMSDRHLGIGSDGLILAQTSDRADIKMSMFNADGSQGEMCGNGIRCLVTFAIEKGIISTNSDSPVSVETLAGTLEVTPISNNDRIERARVSMGEPILKPADVPVNLTDPVVAINYPLKIDDDIFNITCVSMGNPHAVAFIDEDVDDVALDYIGPKVEHNNLFPNRVNFEIVNIIDRKTLKVRVWERGSGLTMACGTGACAVAVAARLQELVGDDVTIQLPGGDLVVSWPGDGNVILEGPVETVFEGDWPE